MFALRIRRLSQCKFSVGVVVSEISPTYYAAGFLSPHFDIKGLYFDLLPADSLGTLSYSNNNPEDYRYDTAASRIFTIDVIDSNHAVLTVSNGGPNGYTGNFYLGCIVSADRSQLFWVNDTRPL